MTSSQKFKVETTSVQNFSFVAHSSKELGEVKLAPSPKIGLKYIIWQSEHALLAKSEFVYSFRQISHGASTLE